MNVLWTIQTERTFNNIFWVSTFQLVIGPISIVISISKVNQLINVLKLNKDNNLETVNLTLIKLNLLKQSG